LARAAAVMDWASAAGAACTELADTAAAIAAAERMTPRRANIFRSLHGPGCR
jgi:hypothetical protein